MLMHKSLNSDQRGAVSMITVIFIAIILTILTTSFIRLTINEQRESTDDDLTTRAYYAAESGVQDAITAIKAGTVTNGADCTPETGNGELSASDNLDTAYTCQTIDESPSNYQAFLEEGESVFFRLESSSNDIQSLNIKWHIKGTGSDADGSDIALRASNDLPQQSAWGSGSDNYPAMLRTQIISAPNNNVSRNGPNGIASYVGYINPANTSTGTNVGTPSGLDRILNAPSPAASCSTGVIDGEYVCEVSINGFSDAANEYWLRIGALYTSTHIMVEALDSAGNAVAILNAQAVVDVTGRAGDVYRRVEERVSLIPDSLWPDYAILTAEDLCKNFIITSRATGGTASDPDFSNVNPNVIGSCRY